MTEKYESYKKYMTCLGNVCGTCCCNYRKIETSTLGFIEEFGKFKDTLEPGLHYFNPFTENIRTVELKTKVVDMRNQVIYTKDNISVDIDTTLFYRIVDAYRATYIVSDVLQSVSQMTYVTMRTICG